MKKEKKDLGIILIRGTSKLCQEAEDFLKENNFKYEVLYEENSERLPIIISSVASVPYRGRQGFNYFKATIDLKKD